MAIQILGSVDPNRLFCSGSFTKLLTTFVILSLLAKKYDLDAILDDDHFFDVICSDPQSKDFLQLFQQILDGKFSIHDICSYYAGLPYTFDVSTTELEFVDAGNPFKHHSILDENTFLTMCRTHITPLYKPRCKFHYSELSIIFLGFLIEKVYALSIEELYQQCLIDKYQLKQSLFSRKRVPALYCQDLSDQYDYPSIAILDHGYICYSNGFFTTLNDMKICLEELLKEPIFHFMTDIRHARAASNTIMNGLTVELRQVGDDILYGYEGLSFSGCNIWAYSTKQKKGFLTFTNDEEEAYNIYNAFGYSDFDKVPEYTQQIYRNFLKQNNSVNTDKAIPHAYQGDYQRVRINEKELEEIFIVASDFIIIRNPETIKYDVIYANGNWHIKGKDNRPGAKVGFMQSQNKDIYMFHDGTLYKKIRSI